MHVWRARLQQWLAPLAVRCPFSPNSITISALILNVIAAALFYLGGRDPRLFLAGIVVVIIAGLADSFDGTVARLQGKVSRYGDFLDHFCDRLSDLLLLAGWLIGNGVRIELTMLATIAVMLNGYLGTQIEATYGDRHYETMGRGEFILALIVFPTVSYIVSSNGWRQLRFEHFTVAEWMTLLLIAFGIAAIAQRLALAARLEKP